MTFNIHKARSPFMQNTLQQIKKFAIQGNFDFLLLQEIRGSTQLEVLADSIWKEHCYGKNAHSGEHHHGNATLSHYPIKKWENENVSVNIWEKRGLLHSEILLPNQRTLHLFNVHLNLRHKDRLKQAKKLIDRHLKAIPPEAPFILAGDFNDWNQKLSSHFEETLGLFECHKALRNSYAKTFPSLFPFLSLDRIYAKNIIPIVSETLTQGGWNSLSDHLPLTLEFEA